MTASTRSTSFWSLSAALTVIRPGAVKAIARPWAVALLAIAALMTPWGVAHSCICRSPSAIGAGTAASATTFHAKSPLTRNDLALFAAHRLHTAAAGWILALRADEIVAQRGRLVVDRSGEGLDVEARPRLARRRALAGLELHATAAVLDRLEAGRAEGGGGVGEHGVLGGRG